MGEVEGLAWRMEETKMRGEGGSKRSGKREERKMELRREERPVGESHF